MKKNILTVALIFLLTAVCLSACGKEENLVSGEDLADTESVLEQEIDEDANGSDVEEPVSGSEADSASAEADTEEETGSDTNEPDAEEASELVFNEEYLPYIEIDEDCEIYAYTEISGEEYDYAVYGISRIKEDNDDDDSWDSRYPLLYLGIVVLKDNEHVTVLRVDCDPYGDKYDRDFKQIVVEEDVNFDGKNDILILDGHYGNQGFVTYTCYLQTESGFEICPSFSKIVNPSVNSEDEVILSFERIWAASHGWEMYYYIDGEFVGREILTEEPANQSYSSSEDIVWSWTIEEYIDGKWVVTDHFTEEDYDEDYLYQYMVYGPDAHWDIGQDKWESLFRR